MNPLTALTTVLLLSAVTALEYRLSTDVYPLHYDIKVTPYFLPGDGDKRFTFTGETSIVIRARNLGVLEFAVHADYLNFEDVDLYTEAGVEVDVETEYESVTDKLNLQLTDALVVDVNYTLKFNYSGRISDGYDGLYRINYADVDSNEKWLVATQLQRIDARKLFPCFDEPSFKAHFTLHISRPKSFSSFTNTALLETTDDSTDTSRAIDHFATTPKMSTYLVAMIVSEFTRRGDDDLFIIARPEYYNKTEFSYDVSRKVLNYYNELFGVPYPELGNPILQKAALSKFTHNGMENWGLMIYKDAVLVYEDGYSGLSDKQYMITIISHETSHSWFGDSITFEWWGYFWLNEGFARYYQYFATHELYPEYELDKQFIIDQLQNIFNTDARNSSQPLSEPYVASPSELARKFSSITYVKGASVIRMISHAMSEPNFQAAIKEYVKENLGRSVIPADLFKHLKAHWPVSPVVDVDRLLTDWTEQPGFPYLIITLADDGLSATVSQKRFLLDPNDGSDPNLRYTIPLTYTTSEERNFSNTYPAQYLEKGQDLITVNFDSSIEWVMFNIQETGYYRVLYSNDLLLKIQQAFCEPDYSGIHEINRAQYIDDLFAFARIDVLQYDLVFSLLEYLQNETHYTPWAAAFTGFNFVGPYLTVEEHVDFGKYILEITEQLYNQLGSSLGNEEFVLNVYNSKKIVDFNCKYGRDSCTSDAQKILREFLNSGTVIPIDIRPTVFCSGLRDASDEDFDKLLEKFRLEKMPTEKSNMRDGLGCSRKTRNVEKYFDIVLGDDVPVDEKADAMSPLYKQNPENIWPTYKMVTTRLEEVKEAFGSWSSTATLISNIVDRFTTTDQRAKFQEFIEENGDKFGDSRSKLEAALATLDEKLEWAADHLASLRLYFKSRNGAGTKLLSVFALMLVALTYVFL